MTLGALSLDDLTSPESPDEVQSYLLTNLAAEGFPVTAWESGDVGLTLVKVESLTLSDLIKLIGAIARGGLLELAAGAWLTLLARSAYALERDPAAYAAGTARVSVAAGFPPANLAPGQLWITDAAGHRFNATNAAPVVIAAGASEVVPFRAELAGRGHNIGSGTSVSLVTPLPGTSVALESVGGTWLTTQGTDGETDAALRARCRGRWATIGLEKTRDGYAALARNAPGTTTRATRVLVDDASPRGPGTVDVWVAGPSGPLSGPDETATRAFVLPRASVTADVAVANATPSPVNITANIYTGGSNPDAAAEAAQLLTDLIDAAPIGGTIYRAAIIEALMTPRGVFDASVSSPPGNVVLGAHAVATVGTLAITLGS
jgi:uncharacterized phage protein gp47/JayE